MGNSWRAKANVTVRPFVLLFSLCTDASQTLDLEIAFEFFAQEHKLRIVRDTHVFTIGLETLRLCTFPPLPPFLPPLRLLPGAKIPPTTGLCLVRHISDFILDFGVHVLFLPSRALILEALDDIFKFFSPSFSFGLS